MAKPSRSSYSTLEVAKRLGVSLQTVQRWVDAGHLQAWRTPGGHRKIEAGSAERLFAQNAQELGNAAATRQDSSTARLAIVVDDDPIELALLTRLLGKVLPQARVEPYDNGFDALVAIGQKSPAIVITDVHMPHMNGFEMIRHLRANSAIEMPVIIAVSALSPQDLRKAGEVPSGVTFLSKPISESQLRQALQPGM